MTLDRSLAEVHATVRKAGRGAGAPWGVADEGAWVTRTLCAFGFDGCAAVRASLENGARLEPTGMVPLTLTDEWQAEPGPACAVLSGIALADGASRHVGRPLKLARVAAPLLLLPFMMRAAAQRGEVLQATWPGALATTDGKILSFEGTESHRAQPVLIAPGPDLGPDLGTARPRISRAQPDPETWGFLEALAANTYAPDTEESRLSGAGAGLSDND